MPTVARFTKRLSRTDAQESDTHQERVLVPKGEVASPIFPALDESTVNPEQTFEVVAPDGSTHELGFVHYNTKLFPDVDGSRNEYGLLRVSGLFVALGGVTEDDTFVLDLDDSGVVMAGVRRPGRRTWLVIASGDDRQYAGNEGYEDQPDAHYSWDDTVPNHSEVSVGDRIVIWDKTRLLGFSAIEAITTQPGQKVSHRCPNCGKASVKKRQRLRPLFRCQECSAEFDHPNSELIQVQEFRSRHDAAWVSAEDVLDGERLRSLCYSPKSQHSIRDLDWDRFAEAMADQGFQISTEEVEERSQAAHGGHTITLTRARLGQGKFRRDTLARHGAVCAVTGPAPESVLDAAHLYSYAAVGSHLDHGGFPLRKDIHRLFDQGEIAVDPHDMTVSVSAPLAEYPKYAALHGQVLHVTLSPKQRTWIEEHWAQHRV